MSHDPTTDVWLWVGGPKVGSAYTGDDCENCGRDRLERWLAPDNTIHIVCEKCKWDNTAHQYDDPEESR